MSAASIGRIATALFAAQADEPAKPSLLERTARTIERVTGANPEPPKARRIRPLREILQARGVMTRGNVAARPTDGVIRNCDGEPLRYWSDGSLRHVNRKLTKAERKKLRRMKRCHTIPTGLKP